jgi:hypothetical protein
MDSVPHEFRCPISMELMKDPVVCEDGHSYDRESITSWLERSQTSPMTRQPISRAALRPNLALKSSIKRWQEEKAKEPRVVINMPRPSAPPYQPPPYSSYQGQAQPTASYQAPSYPQNAYVTHSIVPYSTPKVREPLPQQVSQAEDQKKKVKIILTLCSTLIFLVIIISILSSKARSHSENDDD